MLVCCLIAAVFTLVNVIASLHQGKLSNPPTYDDVGYFVDGAQRIQLLYDRGVLAVARDFASDPPHAPLSTITAMLAFLLFGTNPWAVPVVNGAWIALVLVELRRWFIAQPLAIFVGVAVTVLSWPLVGLLLLEGRPDVVCGLLTAVGCFYIMLSTWMGAPRRHVIVAAALTGIALLAKPTIAPLTVVLFGLAVFSAGIVDRVDRKIVFSYGDFLKRCLLFTGVALLIVVPYFVFALGLTLDYIHSVLFGALGSFAPRAPNRYESAIFYLWGDGGRITMGPWFAVTAVVLLVAAALYYRWILDHLARVVVIALWCIVAYLSVTIPAVKTHFLGIVVSGAVLLLFVIALRGILSKMSSLERFEPALWIKRVPSYVVVFSLMLFALVSFRWHDGSFGDARRSQKRFALIDELVDEVLPSPPRQAVVVFPAIGPYLNSSVLKFAFQQRRIRNATAKQHCESRDVAENLAIVSIASDVVLFEPGDTELINWVPCASILPIMASQIASDPDLELRRSFKSADGEHQILLYHRIEPLRGLRAVSGFLQVEGPYLQWKFSYVQWAVGGGAVLQSTSGTAAGVLHLEGLSNIAGQAIDVSIDGKPLGECRFAEINVFQTCEIALAGNPGAGSITLRFARHSTEDGVGRAILFRKIELR